ncbi:hypothetical protein ACSQ6I_14925 [Anabaena sp. WFMT]|uniref:hypothetical protein n=1 Tax=Anabaena sp. WFMT TaxID=3449730 RepID=UPI003F23B6CC
MQTLFSLDKVAKNLEQHENSKRIKKLVFCACKNVWENDQDTLDQFKLQELIEELCSLNPTIEHWNYTLSEVVKTLNKKSEYTLVASVILNEIEKIYIVPEEVTGIVLKQPNQNEISSKNFPEKSPGKAIKSQYNQFDLRQNLMKYTNPLRAKIVLFSALYNKFTFKEEDWLKLKTKELDVLLRKLFDSCATIKELESKLNNTIIHLGNSDENTQASSAIIRAMQDFYGDIVSTQQEKALNNYSIPEVKTIVNTNYQPTVIDEYEYDENEDKDEYEEDNNTCQIVMSPLTNTPDQKQ